MCGIIGAVALRNVETILIEGLKRLEYRGYDSAGLAILDREQQVQRLRTCGKVRDLEALLSSSDLKGNIGIAHTRWATHGAPSEQNAHPLASRDGIVLVHNGIIENYANLKAFLLEQGYHFQSETDSETIAHLLHYHLQTTHDLRLATQQTVSHLKGAYALGILCGLFPGHVLAVRQGSPLVIGLGQRENFFASDPLALIPLTQQFIYLEDGDIADVTQETVTIYDAAGHATERRHRLLELTLDAVDRGEHRHYMSKEIFEQPDALTRILEGRVTPEHRLVEDAFGALSTTLFPEVQHIQFIACGTSYHAALVARYWIEALSGIPCSVEVASEFRYRKTVVQPKSLLVTLSQSGETADTLAALRLGKKIGFLSTLAICNVAESSLVRESDLVFLTRAGVEIGVASTKAFTAQLVALMLLTLALGRNRTISNETESELIQALCNLPTAIATALTVQPTIRQLSAHFADKEHALFLGRGALYPIALEGALKLKEISYIHAEGYPAGELKHGPLALVDKHMPVIAIAPNNELLEKLASNLEEVRARGGTLYVFTDSVKAKDRGVHVIEMPTIDPWLAPIMYTIPLQLLAYHVAVLKGTDVDQPRNLAKSVTVE